VLDEVLLGDRRIGFVVDRPNQLIAERGSTRQRGIDAPETALLFPLG
jgi:hypothetical protein